MGARIVSKPVEEMFRQGWVLKLGGDVRDKEAIERTILSRVADLRVNPQLKLAMEYRRAYGGGAVLIGADDGQDLVKPLDMKRVKSVNFLTVLRPRELWADTWYTDADKPRYGEPETYTIQPETETSITERAARTGGGIWHVHESRLVVFRNKVFSRRHLRENHGWGDSVFVRILNVLAQFHQVWGGSANLLSDFAQAVLKIKGLAELLSGNKREKVMDRAMAIDLSRSIARSVILDSEESWERQPTPLTGYPDMMDKWMLRLAAAASMPVSMLFGQAPAGLNATGDSDIRFFYDTVSAEQDEILRPGLEYLLSVLFAAKTGPTNGIEPETWTINFNALWQLSQKEIAERNKAQSDADLNMINGQVCTPEEIAMSRFGGENYSLDTKLDLNARRAMTSAIHEREQAAGKEGGSGGKSGTALLTPTDVANRKATCPLIVSVIAGVSPL